MATSLRNAPSRCGHVADHELFLTFANPTIMDIAATKLQLMQQLMSIMDEKTLKRVVGFFKKEVAVVEDTETEITEGELAEFDRNHAAYRRGDLKTLTGEASVKRLRKAQLRDETL